MIEAISIPNLRYRNLSNLSDHLLEGDFTTLLETSITVPRGQIHPQKKRPRKIVRTIITIAGQNNKEKLKLSIRRVVKL